MRKKSKGCNQQVHTMALILQADKLMVEQLTINEKNVWIKVQPYHVDRDNPNIIPTEYFTASYFLQQPAYDVENGYLIKDDNNEPKLFESPVAAVSYAEKMLEKML